MRSCKAVGCGKYWKIRENGGEERPGVVGSICPADKGNYLELLHPFWHRANLTTLRCNDNRKDAI